MNTESKVTPPTSIPLGPLRVIWELRGALVSTTLLVQMTADKMRVVFVELYIHLHEHRVPHSSYVNSFLQLLWASVFILLTCIWRGWQRWVRNLPSAQTQRIGSPLVWPLSERRPAYLHLVPSPGPFRGSDPCLVSGSEALLPGLQGNMTTYTRPRQTCDWHVAAHFQQHSHPPRQITPQNPDRWPYPGSFICSFVTLHMLLMHFFWSALIVWKKLWPHQERRKWNQDHKSGSVQIRGLGYVAATSEEIHLMFFSHIYFVHLIVLDFCSCSRSVWSRSALHKSQYVPCLCCARGGEWHNKINTNKLQAHIEKAHTHKHKKRAPAGSKRATVLPTSTVA